MVVLWKFPTELLFCGTVRRLFVVGFFRVCGVEVLLSFCEWGCSSAGRAPVLHAGGQEFDPPHLHQI